MLRTTAVVGKENGDYFSVLKQCRVLIYYIAVYRTATSSIKRVLNKKRRRRNGFSILDMLSILLTDLP